MICSQLIGQEKQPAEKTAKSEKIDKKFFFTIKFSEDYNPSDIS